MALYFMTDPTEKYILLSVLTKMTDANPLSARVLCGLEHMKGWSEERLSTVWVGGKVVSVHVCACVCSVRACVCVCV